MLCMPQSQNYERVNVQVRPAFSHIYLNKFIPFEQLDQTNNTHNYKHLKSYDEIFDRAR